jgi:hypothetical protein
MTIATVMVMVTVTVMATVLTTGLPRNRAMVTGRVTALEEEGDGKGEKSGGDGIREMVRKRGMASDNDDDNYNNDDNSNNNDDQDNSGDKDKDANKDNEGKDNGNNNED